jgi:hypothetical protein
MDPGSKVKKNPDPGSESKNLSIFILTQKMVSKLSDPDLYFLLILDPGSRIRIRDTAPSPPI